MGRGLFYKIAFVLALASFVPLVLFLSRRESPPEKVPVPSHKKQTVENFTLSSTGKERWVLRAPVAIFEDRNRIRLKRPVLTVYTRPPVVIKAEEALFDKGRSELYLKKAHLTSENIEAFSPLGTYYVKRELFTGREGCTFNLKTSKSTTTGGVCRILVDRREVIISKNVKTRVFEVIK